MVYTPVMVPACLAKSRLTMPGSSTPITPMLGTGQQAAGEQAAPHRSELRSRMPPPGSSRMPSTTALGAKTSRQESEPAARTAPGTGPARWSADRPGRPTSPRAVRTPHRASAPCSTAPGAGSTPPGSRPSSNSHGRRNAAGESAGLARRRLRRRSTALPAPPCVWLSGVAWIAGHGVLGFRFIDQLPRQGFGSLRIALLDRIEQRDVQVRTLLSARCDVQGGARATPTTLEE